MIAIYILPQKISSFTDIYPNTQGFAVNSDCGRIAFEIDGNTWHNPSSISEDKYTDDLLKQNSMIHEGWKVFRWTDKQLEKCPDRVKDELITFLGMSPALFVCAPWARSNG